MNLLKYKRVLVLVVVVIVIFIIDRYVPSLVRFYYRHTYKSLNIKDGIEFEKKIRNGTFKTIESGTWGLPMASSKSFFRYLISSNNIMGYGEYGYLLHYAFLYAEKKKDNEMMQLIKEKFDNYWLKDGRFERSDQVTYGTVALDLFRWTNKDVYKSFANTLLLRISKKSEKGLILYREGSSEQQVDAVGLVCPFLFYYQDVCKDTLSLSLARRMAEDYAKWGTDPITGIPCQTYDTKSHIKKNHVNWGRGTSWYILGVYNLESEDSIVYKRIELLNSTLIKMDTYLYPQYLGKNSMPDLSATIPILYYLNAKRHISLSKDQLAQILSPYIDEEGVIRYCSPSITRPHVGVNILYTNLFCQGLLLLLLSEL